MRIIAGAIRNPVAIGVTVLLISLFGAAQPEAAAPAAISRHRASDHLHLHELARRLAGGSRSRAARAAGAGAAGPARRGRSQRQRELRRQPGLPDVRDRHRHEVRARRRHRPHEPPAAAAARLRPAVRAARRRRRRLEPATVVLLRAVAAGYRGADRALSPVRRGRRQAAHRVGTGRRAGRGPGRSARRRAHHRSIWRAPPHWASGSRTSPARPRARPMCPPASSTSGDGNIRCATPDATTLRISGSSCSRGATASRCASRTSRPSRCGRPIAPSSPTRTATRRSGCASCARRARTCSARSRK